MIQLLSPISKHMKKLSFIIVLATYCQFAFAQTSKKLIINLEFGTSNQSSKEVQAGNSLANIEGRQLNIDTEAGFRQIASYIKEGNFSEYNEIIISTATHGSIDLKDLNEHSIVLKDGPLPASSIKDLISVLNSQKKKVALLDFSCFSGANLSLFKDFDPKLFCLVTGDSQNTPSMASFNNSFFANLNKSKDPNIETLYLKARADEGIGHFTPGINTPEGLHALNLLNNTQSLMTDIHDYLKIKDGLNKCLEITTDSNQEKVYGLSNDISEILKTDDRKTEYLNAAKAMKQFVELYSEDISKIEPTIKQSGYEDFDTLNKFSNYLKNRYPLEEKRFLDDLGEMRKFSLIPDDEFSKVSNYLISKKIGETPVLKNNTMNEKLKKLDAFNRLKTSLSNTLGSKKFDFIFNDAGVEFGSKGLFQMAKLERSLYSELYKQNGKRDPQHACRTIVFKKK